MAFYINQIKHQSLVANKKYFFDTNVWYFILFPPLRPDWRTQPYVEFFDQFRTASVNPKPKIIVNSLIMSEVINLHMNLSFKGFKINNPHLSLPDQHKRAFKEYYRPTAEYKTQYHLVCHQFKAYHNYIEFVNDDFASFRPKDLLKDPPTTLEFPDFFYYKLAKKNGYTIVTDDGDFFVEDVEIITGNQKLLDKIL